MFSSLLVTRTTAYLNEMSNTCTVKPVYITSFSTVFGIVAFSKKQKLMLSQINSIVYGKFSKNTLNYGEKTHKCSQHFPNIYMTYTQRKRTTFSFSQSVPQPIDIKYTPNELGTDRHKLCAISYVLYIIKNEHETRTCRNYEKHTH